MVAKPYGDSLLPTGTCFDDAILYLIKEIYLEKDVSGLWLCHGIITPKNNISDNETYSHAWVYQEKNDTCLTWCLYKGKTVMAEIAKSKYYADMMPSEVIYYSPRTLVHYYWRYDRSGPWEDKLNKLCNNYDKPQPKQYKTQRTTLSELNKDLRLWALN